jgi:hypothetical protein
MINLVRHDGWVCESVSSARLRPHKRAVALGRREPREHHEDNRERCAGAQRTSGRDAADGRSDPARDRSQGGCGLRLGGRPSATGMMTARLCHLKIRGPAVSWEFGYWRIGAFQSVVARLLTKRSSRRCPLPSADMLAGGWSPTHPKANGHPPFSRRLGVRS